MKYITNAMKFGNQSRSSSLNINMIFEIADLDPILKPGQVWSQNCKVPDFFFFFSFFFCDIFLFSLELFTIEKTYFINNNL